MNRTDPFSELYEEVTVFGEPALFTNNRIDKTMLPSGYFLYEIRHADEDWGSPCEIRENIVVNHLGTVIINKPIGLADSEILGRYKDMDDESLNFLGGSFTLQEYVERFPSEYPEHSYAAQTEATGQKAAKGHEREPSR